MGEHADRDGTVDDVCDEFGRLNVSSLELDDEHAHYVAFIATFAYVNTNYESESLGNVYGLVRQACCYFYWTVSNCAVRMIRSPQSLGSRIGSRGVD
jgi:hypothetical protein